MYEHFKYQNRFSYEQVCPKSLEFIKFFFAFFYETE